jgi:outer membrane protein insertion porin family
MRWCATTILAVLLACGPVFAQENIAQKSSKVSYDGQKVASVELVANPKSSVDQYKPLIQQKANSPYSSQKVQATIDGLNKTGRFSDIQLKVTPGSEGLHLTFTLEPALYFGVFDFPGATKTFSYTRLLQVIDVPSQTTYTKDAEAAAGGALLKFFISSGYFQAQVRTEPHFDQEHLLANVIFHVKLGKRAKIGNLEVVGPPPAEAKRLEHDAKSWRATFTGASLKPGKKFAPKRINAGIALMKRDLAKQRRLASHTEFDHAAYHPDTNHADVFVKSELGPVVDVSVKGARLSWIPFLGAHREKQLIPIFSEGAIDPDLVEEGRRNLANFFQKKGYFDAKVTTDYHTEPDKITLIYNIVKGRKHTVQQVAFRGNRHIDEDALENVVAVKPHRFFLSKGKYSDKMVAASIKSLEAFYRNRGFEDVKVDKDVVDREPKIYVTFLITEGPETIVENLFLRGNYHLSGLQVAPPGGFNLKPGRPFSPKGLADDRSHIMAAYLDHGYMNAEFDSKIDRLRNDQHRVNVSYNILEKQPVAIDQVLYLGARDTRRSLIRKTTNIPVESALSQTNMLTAESKLYELGVFDWASVEPRRPITDQTQEDVVVKLHESRKNSLDYGFGLQVARRGGNLPSGTIALPGLPPVGVGNKNFTFSEKTFVSPRGSIAYTRNNVRGLAETFTVSALVSRLDQRLVGSYRDPHFKLSGWNSLVSTSIERTTENPIFEAKLARGSWQLEKPLNKDGSRRVQLRYQFQKTALSNLAIPGLVLPQDRNLRLSTLSGTWIRDTRDKPLDASKGFYQTLDLGLTPSAFGSNTNFIRFLGQTSYYKPLGPLVWANRIEWGAAKAFAGDHVPTSERFFSGGETTLRGFPINGAGPQRTVPACATPGDPSTCTNIRVPFGGNQLFIFNSEMRFPLYIMKALGGAVFYDGGNVYNAINARQLIRDYTNTVGFGFRYATPVGPVRVDIGRNLNPVTGIKATQFFITLGQAF